MLKQLPVAALIASLLIAPVKAEGMNWRQFQAAVKGECDAFGASLGPAAASGAENLVKSHAATYPKSGVRLLPYVCLWVQYDVTGQGKPENINVVFKSPVDAEEKFGKAAVSAVKKWEYEGSPKSGAYAMVTFEVNQQQ